VLFQTKLIQASESIPRPATEVYSFYGDFRNLTRFLGDVIAVEPMSEELSRWTIQGPFGVKVSWTVRVTEERTNELIRYEMTSLPGLKTYWEVYFEQQRGSAATTIRKTMRMPLGWIGRAALAVIGKHPDSEVSANLRRLKELMETGRVIDTAYAVRGKFSGCGSDRKASHQSNLSKSKRR
jgi:uncharacterized membrane protein